MANMSYCRFQNTIRDLEDCHEALETFFYEDIETITGEERDHAANLIQTCHQILELVANQTAMSLSEYVDKHGHDPHTAAENIIAETVKNYETAE